jgi:hypothetical protein
MKETARLIIPVWGEVYVSKVVTITLPAVLAPGNLPALREAFEVELVIVTETRLFESIRNSQSFRAAATICSARLVSLDDLLRNIRGDYGMVLTYALFRGFADLGSRATETYLLFLNADFIISDGSLRHLGGLMRDGKRVIHAPSFRVVLEDVWPQLLTLVDTATGALPMPSRDMVKLALAHKHPTVKARTINQRLSHLKWMDQFYWYVDDDTLIGYQSPVALVAIKPERAVGEPVAFWDYGFIPEAAPTAVPHFIDDSDDFFMIEPQSRDAGHEIIRLGWASIEEISRAESLRSTREHRESSKHLLKIHAGDLPADIGETVAESRAYMAEILHRLSPEPAPYVGHPVLGQWFKHGGLARPQSESAAERPADPEGSAPQGHSVAAAVLRALQKAYRRMFGTPRVSKFHPLWMETWSVTQKIAAWQESGAKNIVWTNVAEWLPQRLLGGRTIFGAPVISDGRNAVLDNAPYDVCVCRLTLRELPDLQRLHGELRPLMKDGGHILFVVAKTDIFEGTRLFLDRCNFPDIDVSEIRFHGTAALALLRAIYIPALRPIPTRPIVRALMVCTLIASAPLVWVANARAARRDSTHFSPMWTNLTVEFTVRRAPSPSGPPPTGDPATAAPARTPAA